MSSSNEDLYVSISPRNYRLAKSKGLESQSNFLKTLKILHNLKVLSRQKKDLRENLYRLFDSVGKEVNKIEEKFPKPVFSSDIKKKIKIISPQKDNLDLNMKRDYSKRDAIDEELMAIKQKLAMLNG